MIMMVTLTARKVIRLKLYYSAWLGTCLDLIALKGVVCMVW